MVRKQKYQNKPEPVLNICNFDVLYWCTGGHGPENAIGF